jgi:8-oxo-dGTP pyrophosphatase MutT (NUDIX family)
MHRTKIIDLLESYHPTDKEEISHKKKMIAFIKNHADCFSRTNGEGHITASAWVINEDNSKVLLLLHKKLNRWLQLGGHADGETDVTKVALKEAEEESGIEGMKLYNQSIFDIDIHTIPPYKDIPEHLHYDIRFLVKAPHQEFIKNNESIALEWFSQDEKTFPTKTASMMRMFYKWKEKFPTSRNDIEH